MINNFTQINNIKAKYSTPSEYFKIWKSEKQSFLTFEMDFLNYDERVSLMHPFVDPSQYDNWVGYYASNPTLKSEIWRVFHKFRTLESLKAYAEWQAQGFNKFEESFKEAEKQVSYMLHHDAITGTSRAGTIDDYFARIKKADDAIDKALQGSALRILD